jgi:NAD(P)-dependent dehydrogenase (short-subunit alcohol dehydrogenase family)
VKVAINYCRNEVAANDVLGKVRGLGSDGFILQGDVCRPEDIAGMFRRARQEFGALDIFVANARPEVPTFYQPPMEITLESWQTAVDSQARAFPVGAREASLLNGTSTTDPVEGATTRRPPLGGSNLQPTSARLRLGFRALARLVPRQES